MSTILCRRDMLFGMTALGIASATKARAAAPVVPMEPPKGAPKMVQPFGQAAATVRAYCNGIAPKLLRPAGGIFKYPSIAITLPGKAYSTQLWDWDTLWTTRGLFGLAKSSVDQTLKSQIIEHARGSLLNFLEQQSDQGRIPIMMSVKDPDPFGCLKLSAPNTKNQAKPVFAQLAMLISDESGSAMWFAPYFDRLLAFYQAWTLGNESATGLLVWGDDVAIGNDNDPTTFGRPYFSSANLLLNCLFYEELACAAKLADQLGRHNDKEKLSQQRQTLGKQIQLHCWEPRDRFYYTADVQCVDRRAALILNIPQGMDMSWQSLRLRVQSFTGFLPLWCGLAREDQGRTLVERNYLDDDRFRCEAGVRSLSNQEPMYSLCSSSNPSNWLGPVWIITNYLVWRGLKNYGFSAEADELGAKTLRVLAADLDANGSMNEYYHPDTSKPLSHSGFIDWNLLSLEMIV